MSILDDSFLISSYLQLMKARSDNTFRNIKSAFRQFFSFIQKPIPTITVGDFIKYIQEVLDPAPLKISSKKCRRHQLAGFFEYVKDIYFKEGKIFHNPVPSERMCPFTKTESDIIRVSDKVEKTLSIEQLQEILDYAYNRLTIRDFLLLGIQISAAPRISETRTILRQDVHIEDRFFETGFIKDARKSTIHTNEGLLFFLPEGQFLEEFKTYFKNLNSKWVFPGSNDTSLSHAMPFHIIRKIKKDLGFQFSFHYFRRTLITERMKLGCPEWISEALQNHAASTTERESYIKLKLDEKLQLYDRYFPFRSIDYFK